MIKANELRIGNKVRQAHATLTILAIGKEKAIATDFNRTGAVTYEKIEPIVLTTEILAASGVFFKPLPWIKYVHELQNWFYWTNNKQELTINL